MFLFEPQYSITTYYCFYAIYLIRVYHIYIAYSTEILGFWISSFISLYSFNTLFTETSQSIIVLEIMNLVVFNLVFANNTILSC